MLKAIFAMVFVLLTINSAYAERISIGWQGYQDLRNGTVAYTATIIDHVLDIENVCVVLIHPDQATPAAVNCAKHPYHSQLPSDANTTSFFSPSLPPLLTGAGVWEADQNTGSVQFCVADPFYGLAPCTRVELVQ
jgi:hypothetical protein